MKKAKLLMPLAGVAALSATIVPAVTLSSCSMATINQAERIYLDKVNSYLTYSKNVVSMHKALETLKLLGYDVQNYHLSNSQCEFVFDISIKKFIIMAGDNFVAGPKDYKFPTNRYDLFKFTDSYNKNCNYSQYLRDNYVWAPEDPKTQPFEITTGLDVGNNTHIKYIKYIGDSKVQKTLMLRTFSELVEIDAQADTIYHLNVANDLWVNGNSNLCTFYEVGQVGYMWANNAKLNFLTVDSKDSAAVDVLECESNTYKGTQWSELYADITCKIGKTPKGCSIPFSTPQYARNENELLTLLTSAANTFIRLTDSFNIENATAKIEINKGYYKFIDLAQNTITDKTTLTDGNTLFEISGGSSVLLLDSYRTGEIVLDDHNIQVVGDGAHGNISTLYLNGVNISYTSTDNSGCIRVGETVTTTSPSVPYDAKLYMYGGSIKALKKSADKGNPYAIWTRSNSYTQILYGSITSDNVCVGGLASQDNVYVDVVNGNFKSNNDLCFFIPERSIVHISGGTYEGPSILGMKDGDVVISGGTFHATGTYQEIQSKGSGIDPDGSVIIMDCNEAADYGLTPYITVTNAKMASDHAYIFHGVQSKNFAGWGEADFFGGEFVYTRGEGYEVPETDLEQSFVARIAMDQYGGIWTKIDE